MHSLLAGNDTASDSTSYYAEYDPFDFLYSGDAATQYSDPMYEAVNRWDKTVATVSPNVGLIGWRQDFLSQPSTSSSQYGVAPPEESLKLAENGSGTISPPPPLPPRNQQCYESNQAAMPVSRPPQSSVLTDSYTSSIPANVVLDRRKTCTRLYELISDQRTDDPELLEFYHMVKEVRARYPHDDAPTNVGHVVAAEFNYHYMMDTSIKVIVHPALNTLQSTVLAASMGKEQVKGYGMPVTFTCDSKYNTKMFECLSNVCILSKS